MPTDTQLPRMLGRYALYEKIASGGMASVHLGRLLGPVGFARTVAIKRMHQQFAEDPEFVSMFLDEARLAARIRHPNVVPTLDVVATHGELFLVMDLVQGESLARLIRSASDRDERIPPEMVATMMVGALHGLHAAHEATNDAGEHLELVHRDVSPHNILVGIDGAARVLDFGVAKAAGRLASTRDGQLKGKLAYMAPEQLHGKVTRKTDVYAAAVVLWEALAGRRLFVGDNEGHVLEQVIRGCTAPPSTHAPGLPAALDEVTMRGLSADPDKRFPTARDMARALEVAIPLAAPSRVGDWVEAIAKGTLDERSARIASIESSSTKDRPPASVRDPSSQAAVDAQATVLFPTNKEGQPQAIPGATTSAVDESVATQLSSGSVSSPGRMLRENSRTRRLVGVTGAVALLSLGLAATVWHATSSPGTSPTAASTGPDPSPSSSPSASPSTASESVSVPAVSGSPRPSATSASARLGSSPGPVRVAGKPALAVAPTPSVSPPPPAPPPARPAKHNPLDLPIQ